MNLNERDYNGQYPENQFSGFEVSQVEISTYMSKVYAWMFLGLLITGLVSYFTATTPAFLNLIFSNSIVFYGLIIGELVLVGFLSARLHKMSFTVARLLFAVYAAINGLTLSAIFIVYTQQSLLLVFGITSGVFLIMSLIGYFTKTDLTSMGKLLMIGLIGIVLATLVNFFFKSPALTYIISYVGIAVFLGLTAYDTQKIKQYALVNDSALRNKLSIIGALNLYLDFINLFLFILRIFGGGTRN